MERPAKKLSKPSMFRIAIAVAAVVVLIGGLALYAMTRKEEGKEWRYEPDIELPVDFMIITDHPTSEEDQLSIAALTSVQFHGGTYHPLVICDPEGGLSRQISSRSASAREMPTPWRKCSSLRRYSIPAARSTETAFSGCSRSSRRTEPT